MTKQTIERLLKDLKSIDNNCTEIEFCTAVYLYCRYAPKTYSKINNAKLEQIGNEIKSRTSLFDEDLNAVVDRLLRDDEE